MLVYNLGVHDFCWAQFVRVSNQMEDRMYAMHDFNSKDCKASTSGSKKRGFPASENDLPCYCTSVKATGGSVQSLKPYKSYQAVSSGSSK